MPRSKIIPQLRLNLSWKGGKFKILAVPRSTSTGNEITLSETRHIDISK